MTDRTTVRLSDERKRLFDRAEEILAADDHDEPPRSGVIDAALRHLIESHKNMDDARGELPPETIQYFNTSVLRLHYRTDLSSPWRE
jgi:hypothetical protein